MHVYKSNPSVSLCNLMLQSVMQRRKPSMVAPVSPTTTTTAVIGTQYCVPYPVELRIVGTLMTSSAENFNATDIDGNIIFNLKNTLHGRRVLLDPAGNPIVTLCRKIMTAHDQWQIFCGESTEQNDLIFSVKRSAKFQLKTKLHVFLANNTKEQVCDFKLKGSWFERSCAVYTGQSLNIVALMYKHTAQSVAFEQDNFTVTVYPNMDYAFAVALIVILDEINLHKRQQWHNNITQNFRGHKHSADHAEEEASSSDNGESGRK